MGLEYPFALLVGAILIIASINDIRERRIPNVLPIILVVLFAVAIIVDPALRADSLWRIAAGGIAFVVGIVLFATGIMGGGDVKLFAGLALWHPLANLGDLVFAMGIVGAMLAIVYIIIEFTKLRINKDSTQSIKTDLRAALRSKIPYGVAILGAHIAMYI